MRYHNHGEGPYISLVQGQVNQQMLLPAGEGLIVLEIQEKILDFLVSAGKLILHDIHDFEFSNLPIQYQSGLPSLLQPTIQATGEKDPLPVIAAKAAYGTPTDFDFNVICKLARGRAEVARDSVWELRQDPGYYAEILKELGSIMNSRFAALRHRADWELTMAIILSEFVYLAELWSIVYIDLRTALTLQQRYCHDLANTDAEDWPDSYVQSLIRLEITLTRASMAARALLKTALLRSPTLRHLWKDVSNLKELKMPPFLVPTQKKSHNLMPILLSLLTMDNSDLIYPLHQVTEGIERLLASDPNRNALITPYVWKMLTDIQVLEEMNRELVRYCPRLRPPACKLSLKFNGVNRSSCNDNDTVELGKKIMAFGRSLIDSKLGTLLTPDGNNFYYPAEKQRSEHHTLSIQKAE